jgi:hypothetical protein
MASLFRRLATKIVGQRTQALYAQSSPELYITTASKPEPSPVPPNYDPIVGYLAGRLHRADPRARGSRDFSPT